MINILCTVLWVPHRVVRTIRCSQLHESFLSILGWRGWIFDVVGDRVEVHVDEGGSRFCESNLERWRHVIVSLSNSALLECWSQCSPRFFRSKLFFHCVCTWAVLLNRLPCSIVSMLNTDVFRQFLRFPRSIWRAKFFVKTFFIDLVGTGRFTRTTNTSSVQSGFTDRSQIGLGIGWVSWENVACWTSPDCRTILPTGCCSTVEPNWSFPLVQWWSCRNEIFGGGRGTCMISHTRILQFSISQLLECSKLEVFLER